MERTPVKVPATTMPVDPPAETGRTTPEAVMATPAAAEVTVVEVPATPAATEATAAVVPATPAAAEATAAVVPGTPAVTEATAVEVPATPAATKATAVEVLATPVVTKATAAVMEEAIPAWVMERIPARDRETIMPEEHPEGKERAIPAIKSEEKGKLTTPIRRIRKIDVVKTAEELLRRFYYPIMPPSVCSCPLTTLQKRHRQPFLSYSINCCLFKSFFAIVQGDSHKNRSACRLVK
jgi:hypothetical protein